MLNTSSSRLTVNNSTAKRPGNAELGGRRQRAVGDTGKIVVAALSRDHCESVVCFFYVCSCCDVSIFFDILRTGLSVCRTIQSVGGCNEGERDDSGEETHSDWIVGGLN